jgi:hypothetical protein
MRILQPLILRSISVVLFGGVVTAILSFAKPVPVRLPDGNAGKPERKFTVSLTGDNNFSSSDMTGSGNITAPSGTTVTVVMSASPGNGFYLISVTVTGVTFTNSGGSTIEASGQGTLTQPEVVTDTFIMPSSGSVPWSGGYTICGSGSTGSVNAH